ncbi:class I SAM-dependent methyltransferase [Minwuia sp.]|uniref:class I SAM-dependent methyltransferase n=1 Tax=Minwuia sp. TaxID=2493630 RepID=UPI003A919E02
MTESGSSTPERQNNPTIEARLWLRALRPILARIASGRVILRLPDGSEQTGGSGEPVAEIDIHDWRTLRRLLLGGELGLAKSYLAGEWRTPDLLKVFQVAQANMAGIRAAVHGTLLSRLISMTGHRRRANTRRGSRRNIAAHYDLGNGFYETWLDPTMTYSSAQFEDGANDLETAQLTKYRSICRLAGIKAGDRVLEIGCGWGGFADVATREFGATVEGITLSKEQLAYAQERARRHGFDDRASFHLTDYRDTTGEYDHIVSIEMFEAVGEENWPVYFQTVRDRLKPGGAAVVQAITIQDGIFESYRRRVDFIQKYIFPGGMLPSPQKFRDGVRSAGLAVNAENFFGGSYAQTLLEWHTRFNDAWEKIAAMPGFDQRFRRMWNFYLLYCTAGFQSGAIDVAHFRLTKPNQDAPAFD